MRLKILILLFFVFALAGRIQAEPGFISGGGEAPGDAPSRGVSDEGGFLSEGGGFLSSGDRESGGSGKKEDGDAWVSGGSFFLESEEGSPLFPDDDFIEVISEEWGKYERSSRKIWVQYDEDDQSAKSRVDFENGEVTIETVVEADTPEEAREMAKELVVRRLDRLMAEDKKSPIPVFDNTLVDIKGGVLTEDGIGDLVEAPNFIIKVVKRPARTKRRRYYRRKRTETSRGYRERPSRRHRTKYSRSRARSKARPGKYRYKTKSKIKMRPDHLISRAKRVFPIIQSQCGSYKLDESLVLSVIHVESYFNPRAVSHVGAVGLMQLMPQYGGKEAYRWLFKKNREPSREYLMDPSNNIQLGCAYLHLLHDEYFRGIKEEFKKRYASVAGYNWGPGSVKKKVIRKGNISRMDDEEFFKFLYQRVPKETRNYITKVREKEDEYRKALKKK